MAGTDEVIIRPLDGGRIEGVAQVSLTEKWAAWAK
jgi:hypothetical protein